MTGKVIATILFMDGGHTMTYLLNAPNESKTIKHGFPSPQKLTGFSSWCFLLVAYYHYIYTIPPTTTSPHLETDGRRKGP